MSEQQLSVIGHDWRDSGISIAKVTIYHRTLLQ